MSTFTTKEPIIVSAEQWFPDKPVEGVYKCPRKDCQGDTVPEHWEIDTAKGRLRVSPGDWVVTGVTGLRFLIAREEFEATYTPTASVLTGADLTPDLYGHAESARLQDEVVSLRAAIDAAVEAWLGEGHEFDQEAVADALMPWVSDHLKAGLAPLCSQP